MTDNKEESLAIYNEIEQAVLLQPEGFIQIELIKDFVKQHGQNNQLLKLPDFERLCTEFEKVPNYPRISYKAQLIASFYSNREVLRAYYQLQSSQDQELIRLLTYSAVASYPEVKSIFGKDVLVHEPHNKGIQMIVDTDFSPWRDCIRQEFTPYPINHNLTFQQKIAYQRVCFAFPTCMRRAFAAILDRPKESDLMTISLPHNWQTFTFEAAIFEELPLIISYLQQGLIKKNKMGDLHISSLKPLQKKMQLKTFANDAGYIKLQLLASFVKLPADDRIPLITPALIGDLFLDTSDVSRAKLAALVFPYAGLNTLPTVRYYQTPYKQLREIVKSLPEQGWVTLSNILTYAKYKYLNLNVFSEPAVKKLKANHLSASYLNFEKSHYLQKQQLITDQTITSYLLLAASLGLVDLAYDPSDPKLKLSSKSSHYIHEGRFSACRLTALGAHVLLGKKQYTLPKTAQSTACRFDPQSQTLKVTGNLNLIRDQLSEWTSVVPGEQALRLDTQVILANCKHQHELLRSIKKLKTCLASKLSTGQSMAIPVPWKEQLMTLVYKSKTVYPLFMASVYKLSPHEKALHKLITEDALLKNIVIKGENYTIIVESHHQLDFLHRLAELGYLPARPEMADIYGDQFIKQPESTMQRIRDFDELFNEASN